MTLTEAIDQAQSRRQALRSTRASRSRAGVEEQVVDYQAELDELASAHNPRVDVVISEIAIDAADDRRRFVKYRAVEHAIRQGDMKVQLATFHSLVAHIEADELREDESRVGHIAALRLLAAKVVALRGLFRDDFVPRILAAYAKGSRA